MLRYLREVISKCFISAFSWRIPLLVVLVSALVRNRVAAVLWDLLMIN
jgi:hypothetical protein